ncbi:MAG TPA: hypothetical protein VGT41_04095 [Candidatus Babeliales bacterium]|nr:hypothetical protein [Candidatus Babeliales bacterium]
MKAYLKVTLLLCLSACFGISLNITAAQAAQEEVKEDAYVPKRTQLLTIFLDNSEARPSDRFVLPKLQSAIMHEAGPIITSSSLFYTYARGTGSNTIFHRAWILHEISEHLLIMIPKSYLEKNKLAIRSLGLKMPAESSTTLQIIEQRYKSFSDNDWEDLIKNTGTLFVNALLQGAIFDQHNKEIEWVIYLTGHGFYNESIAGISLQDFPKMLDFFDRKINAALLVYVSCYGAGLNASKIYKDQAKIGLAGEKEYSFPIATQAIGDLEVASTGYPTEQNFENFISSFIRNKYAYEKFLSFIMINQERMRDRKSLGNLPQIRLAYSPIWFPLVTIPEGTMDITRTMVGPREKPLKKPITSLNKELINITETIASTREKPLVVGNSIKKILLSCDYIPFEIILTEKAFPYFTITMPGDVTIIIKKMTLQWKGELSKLVEKLSLLTRHDYKGIKQIWIEELVIQRKNVPNALYTNVFFDFKDKKPAGITRQGGEQYSRPQAADYAQQLELVEKQKELRLQQRHNFGNVLQNIHEKAMATQDTADVLSEKNKILLHAQEQLDAAYQNKNFPEKHRQIIQHYINTLEEGLDASNPWTIHQQITELSGLIDQEFKLGEQEAQKQK